MRHVLSSPLQQLSVAFWRECLSEFNDRNLGRRRGGEDACRASGGTLQGNLWLPLHTLFPTSPSPSLGWQEGIILATPLSLIIALSLHLTVWYTFLWVWLANKEIEAIRNDKWNARSLRERRWWWLYLFLRPFTPHLSEICTGRSQDNWLTARGGDSANTAARTCPREATSWVFRLCPGLRSSLSSSKWQPWKETAIPKCSKSLRAQAEFPSVWNAMRLVPPSISKSQLREKKTHTRILKVWAVVPAFHMMACVNPGQFICLISNNVRDTAAQVPRTVFGQWASRNKQNYLFTFKYLFLFTYLFGCTRS